jgi:hypothetical protein
MIACGANTKLSIFTAAFAAEGWSLAVTRVIPRPAAASQLSPA